MSALEQLEALNPVPELRGNPGPLGQGASRRRTKWRRGVLAAAAAVVAVGLLLANSRGGESIDLEVAAPVQATPEQTTAQQAPEQPSAVPVETTMVPVELAPSPAIDDFGSAQDAAVARLIIPAIDVDQLVVDDVSVTALRKGPGHYPGSAFPGQAGNAAIAGHRTTYGAPFHRLDELQVGDEIFVTTMQGMFEYQVETQAIVGADDVSVLAQGGDNRLTLTTGAPKYSNAERLVVVAGLVGAPAPPVSFERLPLVAEIEWGDDSDVPDISGAVFRDSQPYFAFVGNAHPLATAEHFVKSQFGDWSDQVDLAVAEQNERTTVVRWTDTRHDTGGWIIVFFADGVHHVWNMTMDDVEAPIYQSQTGGRGFARSDRPLTLEVFRPVPYSATPDFEEFLDDPQSADVLVSQAIGGAEVETLVSFDVAQGMHFQEVRMIVRNDDGEQIGGLARSLALPMLDELAVVTVAGQSDQLRALLASHPEVIAGPLAWDRWQSVELLRQFAPDLAPDSVDEVPRYEATMLALRPVSTPQQLEDQTDLLRELRSYTDLITIPRITMMAGETPGDDVTPEPPRAPADSYVIDELPSVDLCRHLQAMGWARPEVWVNPDRQIHPSPQAARDSAPETATGHVVEFRSTNGDVIGFARPTEWSPWMFHSLAVIERVDNGWVLARWERAPC